MKRVYRVFVFTFVIQFFADLVAQPTTYSNTASYIVGDLAINENTTYIAISGSIGQTPPNPAYWTDLSVVAVALATPTEAAPTLDTQTILNSMPNKPVTDVTMWNVATSVGNGWNESSWFGYYMETTSNWIYHYKLGWLYPAPAEASTNANWFYHGELGWILTSSSVYPYTYQNNSGVTNIGNNWNASSWFGYYMETSSNWIYHSNLGWLYPSSSDINSTWFFNTELGWFWTSSSVYPYLFSGSQSSWLYFNGSAGSFYKFGANVWVNYGFNGDGGGPTPYSNTTIYTIGNLVFSGSSTYIAIRGSTGQTPPNTSYWTDLSVAATSLVIPTEAVPTLDTQTILNSLPGFPPDSVGQSPTMIGRWSPAGFEDNTLYEFTNSHRYTIYKSNGQFGTISDAIPNPNPWSLVNGQVVIDLHFGNTSTQLPTFYHNNTMVELRDESSNLNSTLFREGYSFSKISVTSGTGGTVVVSKDGMISFSVNSNTVSGYFPPNSQINLFASPSNGYFFSGWSGDSPAGNADYSLSLDSNKSLTANFSQSLSDPDNDGLSNYDELVIYNTLADNNDTDSDGFSDGFEVNSLGTSPTYPNTKLASYIAGIKSSGETSGMVQGKETVQADPNSYGLVTQTQYDKAMEKYPSMDINATPYTVGWYFMPSRGWLFTSNEAYPYIFDSNTSGWLYFETGNKKPRFYEYGNKKWFEMTEEE